MLSPLSGTSQVCVVALKKSNQSILREKQEEGKGAITIPESFCHLISPTACPQYKQRVAHGVMHAHVPSAFGFGRGDRMPHWKGSCPAGSNCMQRAISGKQVPAVMCDSARPNSRTLPSPRLSHETGAGHFAPGKPLRAGAAELRGWAVGSAQQLRQKREAQHSCGTSRRQAGARQAESGNAAHACCSRAAARPDTLAQGPRPDTRPGQAHRIAAAAGSRRGRRQRLLPVPLPADGRFRGGSVGPAAAASAWRRSAAACRRPARRRPSESVPRRRSSTAPASRHCCGTPPPPGRVRGRAGGGAASVAGGARGCPCPALP